MRGPRIPSDGGAQLHDRAAVPGSVGHASYSPVVLDAQNSGSTHAERWQWPVLGLAVIAVIAWAASYSWLLGLTRHPRTRRTGVRAMWLGGFALLATTASLAPSADGSSAAMSHPDRGRCLHVDTPSDEEETWRAALGFPRPRSPASTGP